MFSAAVLTILSAFAGYTQLLAIRAALGWPWVAYSRGHGYLGEEIEGPSLRAVDGAVHCRAARLAACPGALVASMLSDFLSWRWALGVLGVAGVLAAMEFWRSLPASKNFVPSTKGLEYRAIKQHFPTAACRGCSAWRSC